jgi:hypothetical protein
LFFKFYQVLNRRFELLKSISTINESIKEASMLRSIQVNRELNTIRGIAGMALEGGLTLETVLQAMRLTVNTTEPERVVLQLHETLSSLMSRTEVKSSCQS